MQIQFGRKLSLKSNSLGEYQVNLSEGPKRLERSSERVPEKPTGEMVQLENIGRLFGKLLPNGLSHGRPDMPVEHHVRLFANLRPRDAPKLGERIPLMMKCRRP